MGPPGLPTSPVCAHPVALPNRGGASLHNILAAWVVPMLMGSLVGLPRRATPRILGRTALFSTPRCRTVSSARRLTVLPRPGPHVVCRWVVGRTAHTGQKRVAKRTKAAFSRSNTCSRALIVRSRSRTECPALLYTAIFTHAPAQQVATRRTNTRSKDQTVNSSGALIHKLKLDTPCNPRRRHIRSPQITKGVAGVPRHPAGSFIGSQNGHGDTHGRNKVPKE